MAVTDFEPTSDLPDRIDDDDTPVASTARLRDEKIQRRRKKVLRLVLVVLLVGFLLAGFDPLRSLITVGVMYALLSIGFAVVGSFARPVPAPPPPGELRKVKLTYRCNECGTQLRITLANDEVPDPPRHCTEEMELIATMDDAL